MMCFLLSVGNARIDPGGEPDNIARVRILHCSLQRYKKPSCAVLLGFSSLFFNIPPHNISKYKKTNQIKNHDGS